MFVSISFSSVRVDSLFVLFNLFVGGYFGKVYEFVFRWIDGKVEYVGDGKRDIYCYGVYICLKNGK